MDRYIRDVEGLASEGFSIIKVSAVHYEGVSNGRIVLIPELFENCPKAVELFNSLLKRVKTKASSHSASVLCSVALCCICSYGYTLNHMSLRGLSSKDMRNIWGILETMRVSSSAELSEWLKSCIKERTQQGYEHQCADLQLGVADKSLLAHRVSRRAIKPEQIGVVFSEKIFGVTTTVRDAMISDMKMLLALRFINGDPVVRIADPTPDSCPK